MAHNIDKYQDKKRLTPLEHILSPDKGCTQLGDFGSVFLAHDDHKSPCNDEFHNRKNKLSASKPESMSMCLNKMNSISTTCSFKGTDDISSHSWDEQQYLKLLNSFQGPDCVNESSIPSSPKTSEDSVQDKSESSTFDPSDDKYDIPEYFNNKVVFKKNKMAVNVGGQSSQSSKVFDEFDSVCKALNTYNSLLPSKNRPSKFDSDLFSKRFINHLHMTEELFGKETSSNYKNKLYSSKSNKKTTSAYSDTDSDSSSTISSTSSSDSTYVDKQDRLQYNKGKERKDSFVDSYSNPRKKARKMNMIRHLESPPTSLEKYLPILDFHSKAIKNEKKGKDSENMKGGRNKQGNLGVKSGKNSKKIEGLKDENGMEEMKERKRDSSRDENDLSYNMDNETNERFENNILESLDKIGGVKYEPGSVDLRRKYKSFEQLCFGLGCVVAPTKQELEMCSQLSKLGDESILSQYETSVYQSCLLRTRSFEGIWKKFCNRSIGIIRKYVLQGIYRLLSLIEFQNLVEPFLKVILLDLGTDRQDQQLFLNIVQEEMNMIIKDKFVMLKLNSSNSLTLDDVIEQMYIQLYRMALLSSSKTFNFEGNLSFANARNGISDITTKLENIKRDDGECNLLDKLITLYNKNFKNYELVVILDKLNPNVNDMFYLLQMLNTRKLLPIKSILIVCTNNQHLERYCNSRIYSNLGIFECNMINVPSVIDEIMQVVMYDSSVQDFLPNYKMLHEIYQLFYFEDCSLTLFVLRIYQLYEQYYNRYIFSYASTVPSFVFDDPSTQDIKCDLMSSTKYQLPSENQSNEHNISRDPNRLSSMLLNTSNNISSDDKNGVQVQLEKFLLPKESFITDNNLLNSSKMSDISTTTSLRSLAMMSVFDKTPSSDSVEINSSENRLEEFMNDNKSNSCFKLDSNDDVNRNSTTINSNDENNRETKKSSEKDDRNNSTEKDRSNDKGDTSNVDFDLDVDVYDTSSVDEDQSRKDSKNSNTKSRKGGKMLRRGRSAQKMENGKNKQEKENETDNSDYKSKDTKKKGKKRKMDETEVELISDEEEEENMERGVDDRNNNEKYVKNNIEKDSKSTEKGSKKSRDGNGEKMYERDTEKNLERVDMAKRLYSIYSLLCISNNMSENHVAYLELKLGMELDLEKIVLELLPLNTLILLQRRVLFQLGVDLLYKLMVFTPDSYNIRKRLKNLSASLPTFTARYESKLKDERDKPLKDLIKRTLKYLVIRSSNPANLDLLKTTIIGYNHVYKSSVQVVINIQTFLNWKNYYNFENQEMLREMNYMLDENMELSELVKCIKNKLFMCFFPFINTYKLSNLIMLQGYSMTFRSGQEDGMNGRQVKNDVEMNIKKEDVGKSSEGKVKYREGLKEEEVSSDEEEESRNTDENGMEEMKERNRDDGNRGSKMNTDKDGDRDVSKEDREENMDGTKERLILRSGSRLGSRTRLEVESNLRNYSHYDSKRNQKLNSRRNSRLNMNNNMDSSSSMERGVDGRNENNTERISDRDGDDRVDRNTKENSSRDGMRDENGMEEMKERKRDDGNRGSKKSRDNNYMEDMEEKYKLSSFSGVGKMENSYSDTNYLMYIYRYVKYKMINMWKLFIIYYYLVTSSSGEERGDKELIEIYMRFNINIELLEKIYKVILLNPATNSTISSKETQGLLKDKSGDDDDIQLCYLIKNSLSNINVKFM